MIKENHGRFCKACEKTVVDFSKMNEEEISTYLKNSKEEYLCIRAKSYQLEDKTASDRFLLKLRSLFNTISFTPLRVALLALVTSLLSLSSCFMGKRMDDVPRYKYSETSKSDTTKTNQQKPR
jgi:hypothetical protein